MPQLYLSWDDNHITPCSHIKLLLQSPVSTIFEILPVPLFCLQAGDLCQNISEEII